MAKRSGGPTGKTQSRTGTSRPGARRRATSKPLIIDVEADAVRKAAPTAEETSPKASQGLDEATAQAAGLSARADSPRTQSTGVGQAASTDVPSDTPSVAPTDAPADIPSDAPSGDSVQPVVPPGAMPSGASGSGPGAFYLFAAGLVGALLSLVMVFLASLLGLFSLSDGRVDDQAASLAALNQRVGAIEAQESAQPAPFDPAVLSPLEDDIAVLREQLSSIQGAAGDAGPAIDLANLDDSVASALEPVIGQLDARLGATEDSLASLIASLQEGSDGDAATPALIPVPDPALAARLDEVEGALTGSLQAVLEGPIANLQASLGALEQSVAAEPVAPTALPETVARLDALDGLLADTGTRLDDVGGQVASVTQLLENFDARLSGVDQTITTLGEDMTALAAAPIAQMPDRLARLGVALDALAAARDGGGDIAGPLEAASAAAQFDGALAQTFAPVASSGITGALSRADLLADYEGAQDAMRQAAPASEGGGLMGALGDRARQLVSVRAPESSQDSGLTSANAAALSQLNRLGDLVAGGQFADALDVATVLPEAMQTAGAGLLDRLQARVALDGAIAGARSLLLEQISASNTSTDTNLSQ